MLGKDCIKSAFTKDISELDAVGLLIDNSIDAMMSLNKNIRDTNIKICYNNNEFIIEDNCKGLDEKDEETIFIMEDRTFENGLGKGLKIALMKIGETMRVNSFDGNIAIMSHKIKIEDILGDDKEKLKFIEVFKKEIVFSVKFQNLYVNFMKELKDLDKYIGFKYRYLLNKGLNIYINEQKIEARMIDKDLLASKDFIYDDYEFSIKIYNGIKKEYNGVDFIVNDRLVMSRVKNNYLEWKKRIIKKGKTYIDFYSEVFIYSRNIKELGITPSNDKIDFNNRNIQMILSEFYNMVEETRDYFSKEKISVQFDITKEEFFRGKEILESESGSSYIYAKDVVKEIFKYGLWKKS
ncbi:ATP-binding protein [Clostridium massiliamazoniense]|uniref:ATP-binding protein n=1 Tax=Clostridium massiliamazoniense TaxID=1347366 RepID=UPI0006D7E7E6|nr:ATP-binding protein [Clostridium massiliamazoniense]